jgi:hypothetical protein
MKRILLVLLVALPLAASSEETWLGLFMQDKKIGYSSNRIYDDRLEGKAAKRSDTHTLLITGLMGTPMTMDMRQTTWSMGGKPKRMVFRMESAGRVQTMDATFAVTEIRIDMVNGGARSKRTLAIPEGSLVVDDALTATMTSGKPSKQVRTFYVLDPLTVSLVKNTVTLVGPTQVKVRGKTVKATRLDIAEVRATTKVYLDAKGNVVKAEGPMGIEMIPLTKAQALAASTSTGGPDLAEASSLKVDKDIPDPAGVRSLKLRITGRDLSRLPSDEHQTVHKVGASWEIEVHPVSLADVTDESVEAAAQEKPEWVRPSMNIPSDSAKFKALAKQIVGDEKTVVAAAGKILDYVHENMRFNAGIGVLRDAAEVLQSKEGVCRDYAVLTATLLRSAGIPARLAAGVVYANRRFYYHAWAEAWTKGKWIGVDSTRSARQITATHVKLSDGNVDDAFTFTFLENVKIEVIDIAR